MKDSSINLVERIQEFLENEARSCSMDFGYVTPGYVYRMWGGDMESFIKALPNML